MENVIMALKDFYSWETDTVSDRILEIFVKLWMTGLVVIFAIGWSIVVIKTILNPHIWDGVQFGLIDYI